VSVTTETPTPGQSGLAALVLLLRFHGVGGDPEQIRHRFGHEIGVGEMRRCGRVEQFVARSIVDDTDHASSLRSGTPPARAVSSPRMTDLNPDDAIAQAKATAMAALKEQALGQ